MSIFSYAFKHTAVLHRYTGINDTGDAQYLPPLNSEPLPFPCRFEYRRQEILDKNGNKIISEARLFTDTELKPLDVVIFAGQKWIAKSSAPKCDFSGKVDHWEVSF